MPKSSEDSNLVTWLHLSDFHFRSEGNWEQDVVLEPLLSDVISKLPVLGLSPDMVFVTGDIAQSGKKAEYDQASQFFHKLSDVLALDPTKHFFLIPGNHDVNRESISFLDKAQRGLLDEQRCSGILSEAKSREMFSSRQVPFLEFTKKFLGETRGWDADSPWKTEIRQFGSSRIAILCLNSAWCCQDDQDHENLVLGEHQIRMALQDAKRERAHITIALMHHPLEDLKPFDRKIVKEIITGSNGCQFLLRGHLHETEVQAILVPGAGVLEIAAGACWDAPNCQHAVILTQLDLKTYTLVVRAWTYARGGGGFWSLSNSLVRGMTDCTLSIPLSKEFVPKTVSGIAPNPFDSMKSVPDDYARHVVKEFGDLETLMLPEVSSGDRPIAFRLQSVYVPPVTTWMDPNERSEGKSNEGEYLENWEGVENIEPRPLRDLLFLRDWRHFLVSGAPGSGKSTFLRFSALTEFDQKRPRLPIILSLRDFGVWLQSNSIRGKKGDLLFKWAGHELESFGLGESEMLRRSGQGDLLWLLDGLDEIFEKAIRLQVAHIIGSWFSSNGAKDSLVVTSRPHGFKQSGVLKALGFKNTLVSIEPLTQKTRLVFLERWFNELYGPKFTGKAKRMQERFWAAMNAHVRLSELGANPLMLSAIACIFQQGKFLPESRASLYGRIIETLLQLRFGPSSGGSESRVRLMYLGLMAVAREMQESGRARDIAHRDFVNSLSSGCFAGQEIGPSDRLQLEEIAHDLGCHSGLLRVRGNPPRYRFHHLGFQEYLTARAYGSDRDPIQALRDYLDNGNWREVILLTAGYLFEGGPSWIGKDFLKNLLKEYADFPTRHNRLSLALWGATEAPKSGLEEIINTLKEAGLAAIESVEAPPIDQRIEIAHALGQLGDPRLDMEAKRMWVRVPPGKFVMGPENEPENHQPAHAIEIANEFLLGRYPVTNLGFRGFIEAGGYDNSAWWRPEGWSWRNLKGKDFEGWFADEIKRVDYPEPKLKKLRDYFFSSAEPKFWHDRRFNGENQPVVGVNWHEASAFCCWFTSHLREQRPPWWNEMYEVSLPSEVQWEYAARGTANRRFPWGDEDPCCERAAYRDCDCNATTPVGCYPLGATTDGILDLAGNVWEWCLDAWNEDPHSTRQETESQQVLDVSDESHHVERGGSFYEPASNLRSFTRMKGFTWFRYSRTGFRCCIVTRDTKSEV